MPVTSQAKVMSFIQRWEGDESPYQLTISNVGRGCAAELHLEWFWENHVE